MSIEENETDEETAEEETQESEESVPVKESGPKLRFFCWGKRTLKEIMFGEFVLKVMTEKSESGENEIVVPQQIILIATNDYMEVDFEDLVFETAPPFRIVSAPTSIKRCESRKIVLELYERPQAEWRFKLDYRCNAVISPELPPRHKTLHL